MQKRIVITGVNGFVGHHLAEKLSKLNHYIIGIARDEVIDDKLKELLNEYHSADLISTWPDVGDADAIIHLAGLAAVGPSFDNPQLYINGNSSMVTNLCEYYLKRDKKPRILMISSGAVYDSNQPMPITEESQVGFTSPYAVSKILVEDQSKYYRVRGLDCIVVRPFNHIGPGQAPGFILPDFYKRISDAEPEASIKVGNVNTKRDYTDVRDIVEAYALLALAPELKHTFYNVCTGKSLAGKDILELLKSAMNRSDIHFEIDPSLIRPSDIMDIYGDASRLQTELGWHPTHQIDQTIQDFVTSA